jgi:NAD(P)-dependent dehydrogenase (short-subunit alcohol dehydrogenase family)
MGETTMKTVVITGGSDGLGQVLAEKLVGANWQE